jgi:cell wall-associated NlpC family hydrolase
VKGGSAVQQALSQLGVSYKWGGTNWGKALDCSGLVQGAFAKVGVKIPRVTYDQWKSGKAVGRDQLQPGDAVFFHPGNRGPEHVGMYIGNGQFVEAPYTGAQVRVSNLANRSDYMGARRYGTAKPKAKPKPKPKPQKPKLRR